MAKICAYCGKKEGYFEEILNKNTGHNDQICVDCYNNVPKEKLYEKLNNPEFANFTNKSKSEKELLIDLLEVNKKQLDNIHTIEIIMIVFFIMFILGIFSGFLFSM